MSTRAATGHIKIATANGKFVSSFSSAGGGQLEFNGDFPSSLQAFSSTNAILTWTKNHQLTGDRNVIGVVGVDTINITIENGPTITGPLDSSISPQSSVSGSGTWTMAD